MSGTPFPLQPSTANMHNSTMNSNTTIPLVSGQGEENSTLDSADANNAVPLIFAIFFFKFTLILAWRTLRRRTWYFSLFVFALLLETAGLGTQAYLDRHETSHEADVINFALLTISPILMLLTTLLTLSRLLTWTSPTRSFLTLLLRPTYVAPLLILVETIPIGLLLSGTICYARFHSSAPILTHQDALARLTALDTANGLFAAGYAFQTVVLAVFTFVCIGAMCLQPSFTGAGLDKDEDKMQTRWRRFAFALGFVGFCFGGRAVFKLICFGGLASHNFALVESDPEFALFDMLPLFLVCVTYSIFFPGAHLPKRFGCLWISKKAMVGARTLDIEGEEMGKPPAYDEKGVAV